MVPNVLGVRGSDAQWQLQYRAEFAASQMLWGYPAVPERPPVWKQERYSQASSIDKGAHGRADVARRREGRARRAVHDVRLSDFPARSTPRSESWLPARGGDVSSHVRICHPPRRVRRRTPIQTRSRALSAGLGARTGGSRRATSASEWLRIDAPQGNTCVGPVSLNVVAHPPVRRSATQTIVCTRGSHANWM